MIRKEVIRRKAQNELPYRVLDDRVASENTHVVAVNYSYGCSLPKFRHMSPDLSSIETKGTTHGNDSHQLHHL